MFQSTHPRRVWLKKQIISHAYKPSFNPHTHAGCDFAEICRGPIDTSFNPHTHAGCDCHYRLLYTDKICFNPHTHAGCDYTLDIKQCLWFGFNPHTHAGCDEEVKNAKKVDRVSIHTPTQGVTIPPSPYCREILFQSTHPRRVWLLPVIAVTLIKGFNPHTHAGCDISNLLYKDIPVEFQSTHPRRVWQIWRPPIYNPYNVSIHTPTQGVTPAHGIYHWQTQSFNPHTHAGCDMFFGIIDHTHQGFNPHTHAGCDPISNNIL